MKLSRIMSFFAMVCLVIACTCIPCWLVAVSGQESTEWNWFIQMIILFILGVGLALFFPTPSGMMYKETLAVVSLSWILLVLFGAIPFSVNHIVYNFGEAFFESMSGFTTTGATILTDVVALPKSILLWRSLTHWIGGIGVVVMVISLLPNFSYKGEKLFAAEVTGPVKSRLTPRVATTAQILRRVYIGLTVAGVILLKFGGMGWLDSVCHAMGAISTGGFSTYNLSIGEYNSVYFEIVIIGLMLFSGINLYLHYSCLSQKKFLYFKNVELRWYLGIILVSTIVITINLYPHTYLHWGESLRYALFQVISIITTTGYGTANYDLWPPLSKLVLFFLMFVGGCAGSTSGGIKCIRVYICVKFCLHQIKKTLYPNRIGAIKVDKHPVDKGTIEKVLCFICLSLAVLIVSSVVLTTLGVPMWESLSASVSCLWNIGPGFDGVGPWQNYQSIPTIGKGILSFCMLVGRLEFFAVLVLFFPDLWKR